MTPASASAVPSGAQRHHTLWMRGVRAVFEPHVIDFWASKVNRLWSLDRPMARLLARERASVDAWTLWLQPNRHWRGFAPGQHLMVGAEIDGTRVGRSYSLCEAPRADGRIAITVKTMPGGRLSRHLCHDARLGSVLDLGQAFGDMVLPDDGVLDAGGGLFLAAGSGITPLMAMIRAQALVGMPAPITLQYWARRRDEFCFVDELRALAARHPGFEVRFALTRERAVAADECEGRIDAARLPASVPDLERRHVYACGPGGFVENARALLQGRAWSFVAEAFTPPPRSARDPESDAGYDERVQLTLTASGRRLSVPRGTSLLAALETAGLSPDAGCRMGICNTCACGKRAGTTRHLHSGALESEPVSALRLCVNAADSDLVLDL